MGRIRTIKPEFFKHEALYDLEVETGLPLRIAFIGLWTQADKEGRFEARARRLKAEIFPYQDVDFGEVLAAFESGGFIVLYKIGHKSYGCIPSWSSHQKPHHREDESKIPSPPVHEPSMTHKQDMIEPCTEHGRSMDGRSKSPDVSQEGKGREGKGMEKGDHPPLGIDSTPLPIKTDFSHSPEGLAEAWCFHLSRRKLGSPRDLPADMTVDFRELIRLGSDPKYLLKTILDPIRDRGEQFWQFRDRIKKPQSTDTDDSTADNKEKSRKLLEKIKQNEANAVTDLSGLLPGRRAKDASNG